VTSAVSSGIRSTLIGILNSDTWPLLKLYPKELEGVQPKIFEQLSVGNRETFEDLNHINLLEE
jgi:hypothetical protein